MLVALLVAMLAGSPAVAAPICLDEPVAAADAEAAVDASGSGAADLCPDDCLACGHCQSHHVAASPPAATDGGSARLAQPARMGPDGAQRLESHLAFRLKRPPRA